MTVVVCAGILQIESPAVPLTVYRSSDGRLGAFTQAHTLDSG